MTILVHGLFNDTEGAQAGTSSLSPRLEPHLLDVGDLLVETLILETVSVNLCLVILKLSHHILQLLSSLFEVLLVDLKFFCDLRTALLSEDVFELDVEFLLLLDKDILLADLLSLRDQSLL